MERKLKIKGVDHGTITGYDFTVDKPLPLRRAVRYMCLSCVNLNVAEVKICQITDCPLWPHRLSHGVTKDPKGEVTEKRERTPAQLVADIRAGERLKKRAQD